MTDKFYPASLYRRYSGSFSIAKPSQSRKRDTYLWRVNGLGCRRVLRDALPYLNVKRNLALLALGFVETVRPHERTSDRDLLLRERIHEIMRSLQLKPGNRNPDEVDPENEDIMQEDTGSEDDDVTEMEEEEDDDE